jgi:hypothetical protein
MTDTKKRGGSDNPDEMVRCSTLLCGKPAVAYSKLGLKPKCQICMDVNNHSEADEHSLRLWKKKPIVPNVTDDRQEKEAN